jgi:hypothetical protein
MIKDYGVIFEGEGVFSMIISPDNRNLFAASIGGQLKQICLESQEVVHDYGKIHDDRIY